MSFRLKPATEEDMVFVASIVAGLPGKGPRAADLLLRKCALSRVWVAMRDDLDMPTALWGAAAVDDRGTARYWMLGIEPLASRTVDIEGLSRLAVEEMLDHFETLENHLEPENIEMIRLVKSLGFVIDPPSWDYSTGRMLHRIWIARADTRPVTGALGFAR